MIVGEKRIDRCDLRGNQSDHQSVSRLLAAFARPASPTRSIVSGLGRTILAERRPSRWRSRSEHLIRASRRLGRNVDRCSKVSRRERAETKKFSQLTGMIEPC